jgi:hypothetical protein
METKTRTYSIPKGLAQFVHDFDGGNGIHEVLTNAVVDGFDKLEIRLLRESSIAIFKNLEGTVSYFAERTELMTIDLDLPRSMDIRLRLTAKEYAKSSDELLCCCLAQSFTVTV